MDHRFFSLTRNALAGLCLSVVCGGLTACKDDYTLDDPGNYPSWMGKSIYEELSNPNQELLTGSFKTYLRLVDDLGYAETLGRTGSKTVFPANDEAFDRFFASNTWGVSRYEDLSTGQKKMLLFSAMLDNALLTDMLSNVSSGSGITRGLAVKHTTAVSVIDSITHIYGPAGMPENNPQWSKFYDKGISLVMDATQPMIVHFTGDQMTTNNITTIGANSDFEVITGEPYSEETRPTYIFRNKIINQDVTCKNGYIHQVQDVVVPPGNIAEVIRTNGQSNYFSRMLERFSVPFYDYATTNNYNDYAQQNGLAQIDSIYQKRYFSSRSQGGEALGKDPNGASVTDLLPYDPGWNQYVPLSTNVLADLAAVFVPTDEAMEKYFLPGGSGSFLMDLYGKKPNTAENLNENIDSIPLNVVSALLGNLMKSSFVGSVPSKFGSVMDDAADPMGLSLDVINRTEDGKYDVKIANNGVAYMINTVFAPTKYVAVSAPALLNNNLSVINTAIVDGQGEKKTLSLEQNFYAYLLAMSANYGLFLPTNEAFAENFYIDPVQYGKSGSGANGPRAFKFYMKNGRLWYDIYNYSKKNHKVQDSRENNQGKVDANLYAIDDKTGNYSIYVVKSQLIDILNYHTIVLAPGETMGANHYYKTKHGALVYFDKDAMTISAGEQLKGNVPPSKIISVNNQKNGVAYITDRVIVPTMESVYSVLSDPRFSEFMDLCEILGNDSVKSFASDKLEEVSPLTHKPYGDNYTVFFENNGMDYNMKYFKSFNYTVYAPDNDAMAKAYANGLPRKADFDALLERWGATYQDKDSTSAQMLADRDKMLAMFEQVNSFVRYHVQDESVAADNIVEGGTYDTQLADELGIREKLTVGGGGGKLTVTDMAGNTQEIAAGDGQGIVNRLARDYEFDANFNKATEIKTSSFAVVHQIGSPLSHIKGGRYDTAWAGTGAKRKLAAFRKKFDTTLYKRY